MFPHKRGLNYSRRPFVSVVVLWLNRLVYVHARQASEADDDGRMEPYGVAGGRAGAGAGATNRAAGVGTALPGVPAGRCALT